MTTVTPVPKERSYIHHLGVVDGIALSLATLTVLSGSEKPMIAGLGVYALGAPVVHFAHGNAARGLASMGLRIGAPILGGYAGYGLLCQRHNEGSIVDCLLGTGLGVLLGLGGAIGIDYAFLAREKAPVATTQTVSWSPTVVPRKDGMSLGVVGAW